MPLPDLRREKSSTNTIEALGNRRHIRKFATEVDSVVVPGLAPSGERRLHALAGAADWPASPAGAELRLKRGPSRALPTRNPCVQADLAAGHGLPCPIRAPERAAIPVFKPDRAPRPASPFWARKPRTIRPSSRLKTHRAWGPTGRDQSRQASATARLTTAGRDSEPLNRALLRAPTTRNPCVQADLAEGPRLPCPLRAPRNGPQTQCSSQIRRPRRKSLWARKTRGDASDNANAGPRRPRDLGGRRGSRATRWASGVGWQQSPSADSALTTVASVPSVPAIPVFKPFLPRGHGLPCPIRAPKNSSQNDGCSLLKQTRQQARARNASCISWRRS